MASQMNSTAQWDEGKESRAREEKHIKRCLENVELGDMALCHNRQGTPVNDGKPLWHYGFSPGLQGWSDQERLGLFWAALLCWWPGNKYREIRSSFHILC